MEEEIILSNDAFFLLVQGDEPLDDQAYAEAEKIASRFPDGFEADFLRYADGGFVVARFKPKAGHPAGPPLPPELSWPCMYFDATKCARLQAWLLDGRKIAYRWVKNGVVGPTVTVPLQEGPHGSYFTTEKGSVIPIASLASE